MSEIDQRNSEAQLRYESHMRWIHSYYSQYRDRLPLFDSLEWRHMFSEIHSFWSCGWPQWQIAEAMGLSQSQISRAFMKQRKLQKQRDEEFKKIHERNTEAMCQRK